KLDEQGKHSYVQEQVKKRSLQIEPSAMQALLHRLPLDIRTIQTEMEKLELYGGVISRDVVEKLVTRPLEE
ncbi:DNA polymerase III subunit delta, partial [Erysipelatoclostridium ramosum]|nr:DNA polymerase III subunit delta [Thomasclavelia ramosa]